MNMRAILIFLILSLAACATPEPVPTPEVIRVEYSLSAYPWLLELYTCEQSEAVAILAEQRAIDFFTEEADMYLQFGERNSLVDNVYQVGVEQIAVVLNRQNSQTALSVVQVQEIFTGRITDWSEIGGDPGPIQVWVFSQGEDLQLIFNQRVLNDITVTSLARLAFSVEEMATALEDDERAIGIFPLRQLPPDLQAVFTLSPEPVLAILKLAPDERTRPLLACLQKE